MHRFLIVAVLLVASCGGANTQPPSPSLDAKQVALRYFTAVANRDWGVAHGCLDPSFDRLASAAPDSDFNNLVSLSNVRIGEPYPARGAGGSEAFREAVEIVVNFVASYKQTITTRSGPQTRFLLLGRNGSASPWLIFGIGSGP